MNGDRRPRIEVTLDQLRALDALARTGTFAAAAAALGRGHTSILYLVRTLEDALGFAVVDRSGYRTTVSSRGQRILADARAVLDADRALVATAVALRDGWEPSLTVVCDGVVPLPPLLAAVASLARLAAPTRIDVRAEFLSGVEDAFVRTDADLMISVVPPSLPLTAVELAALPASLVARADHPLARGRHDVRSLRQHLLVTVRGGDPRLELSTAAIEPHSTVHLTDFAAKRAALLSGLGYGWLPDALIGEDLARGRLRRIRWTHASRHVFRPRLYHRGHPGAAARHLIAAIAATPAR